MQASPPGLPVTLAQMLDARERRAARQRAAMARHGLPVVSLTMVMPGPIKDSALSRTLMAIATTAVDALFTAKDWPVRQVGRSEGATGPELIYAVAADPLAMKAPLIDLEETHPLGRLWDFHVIGPDRGPISRGTLGRKPRRCLICDLDAHACARSQRHPLAELMTAIEGRVDAYRRGLSV